MEQLLQWRRSTFTDSYCVELADTGGEAVAMRNSNRPGAGTLHDGGLDDLT
jgi:hypothetical protein